MKCQLTTRSNVLLRFPKISILLSVFLIQLAFVQYVQNFNPILHELALPVVERFMLLADAALY